MEEAKSTVELHWDCWWLAGKGLQLELFTDDVYGFVSLLENTCERGKLLLVSLNGSILGRKLLSY